jgi:NAD(P)-dependent dehydrogenase (short-subunit alcohol dehydrogenase family)
LVFPGFDLKDKVVFITGAGRGIERGITEVLAEAGADVAVNALTENHVVTTLIGPSHSSCRSSGI